MTKTALTTILTKDAILDIAGDAYFARGANYFSDGAVESLTEINGIINARVGGTQDYRTKIWVSKNDLDYSCSCPLGRDYEFCKHLVTTGLAWLEQQKEANQTKTLRSSAKKKTKKRDVFDTIRDYLGTLPQEQLVDIIIEQTVENNELRNLLYAQSTATLPPRQRDFEVHRKFIKSAIEVNHFIDYRGVYDYTQTVQPVIDLLKTLLRQGHAEDVVELAQYALPLIFDAYNNIDDDGYFSPIPEEIVALHLKACKKAKVDPEQLANSVFELQMRDGFGFMNFENYQPVLKKNGMQKFRSLAQQWWQKVPEQKQKDQYWHDHDRYQITDIMKRLAVLGNDTDALVEIKTRDLSNPYNYFDIATTYAKAKRYDEALQWAQKGAKAFPYDHSRSLSDFIINEYHRRKQHDKAQQLMWDEFTRSPNLRNYQDLKSSADKTKAWEFWRKKAIKWITDEFLTGKFRRTTKSPRYKPHDHSILVEIYLWEKDTADALQAAKTGGCAEHLWFDLARACEKSAAQEAINIYQAKINGIVNQTNNNAYDRAANILKTIKKLMVQLGQSTQFSQFNELRSAHKAKRNFIKKIEKI